MINMSKHFEKRMRQIAYCNRPLNKFLMRIKKSLDEVAAILNGECKKGKKRG